MGVYGTKGNDIVSNENGSWRWEDTPTFVYGTQHAPDGSDSEEVEWTGLPSGLREIVIVFDDLVFGAVTRLEMGTSAGYPAVNAEGFLLPGGFVVFANANDTEGSVTARTGMIRLNRIWPHSWRMSLIMASYGDGGEDASAQTLHYNDEIDRIKIVSPIDMEDGKISIMYQ